MVEEGARGGAPSVGEGAPKGAPSSAAAVHAVGGGSRYPPRAEVAQLVAVEEESGSRLAKDPSMLTEKRELRRAARGGDPPVGAPKEPFRLTVKRLRSIVV